MKNNEQKKQEKTEKKEKLFNIMSDHYGHILKLNEENNGIKTNGKSMCDIERRTKQQINNYVNTSRSHD